MEDIDTLLKIIADLINLVANSKVAIVSIGSIIGFSIIYKIGFNAGNKKKSPEFKVKLKDSYSLEELDNLSLKKPDTK
ncbi:MAG: hypothetical protein V3U84_09170 [Thiotrichaceae bacterium]